ncbi:hypothetical protein CROQUDRAFT_20859, partial [Cronartium quercuum f. sp. fusiforme G11]
EAGDEIVVSALHCNNLTTNARLANSFVGLFLVTELMGNNAIRLYLHGTYARKHPVYP